MSLPENRIPTHPGKILLEEFLVPMGISQAALARHLGIPAQQINAIVHGRRGVTATTAWLLAQAFNTTPEFWMRLQVSYDLAYHKPKQALKRLITSDPYLAEIASKYSIQSPNEVRRFLAAHDFLPPFLIEAIEPLRQYFPGHALSLSVQTDPDTRVKKLLLSIDIQNNPDQAMQRLDQMDAEWWFNISPKVRDLVLITLSAAG
jgi:addiction module HigA family antidote